MSSFTKIKAALEVAHKRAEFELYELDEDPKPVLIIAPASIENREFFNASLRASPKETRGKKFTEREMIEIGLKEMHDLWPQHVVVGWRGIRNDVGEEVPYSPALCRELFEALPADVLIRLKAFAQDMANFRSGGEPGADAAAIAGN